MNNARISSAEVLDLTAVRIDSQWQAIDPMPAKRENFAAGTVKGKVYVVSQRSLLYKSPVIFKIR